MCQRTSTAEAYGGLYPGVMEFTKAHGTGNDFVVFDDLEDRLELSADFVRAVTDRRSGVGGDGVLRIGGPQRGAPVFMDYRNADGSVVEMCGNGVRVVAKHVVDRGTVIPDQHGIVSVATRAGVKSVLVHRSPDGLVDSATVDMGPAVTEPDAVPFVTSDARALVHTIDVEGREVDLSVVSMGNPHAVLRVDDVDDAPVHELGPLVERHERFPRKANVGFVEVVDDSLIRLRVWERGVGETASCGTGACAAVVALQRLGHLDVDVDVEVLGGRLRVQRESGGPVYMSGNAVEVFRGTLDASWLQRAGAPAVAPAGLEVAT